MIEKCTLDLAFSLKYIPQIEKSALEALDELVALEPSQQEQQADRVYSLLDLSLCECQELDGLNLALWCSNHSPGILVIEELRGNPLQVRDLPFLQEQMRADLADDTERNFGPGWWQGSSQPHRAILFAPQRHSTLSILRTDGLGILLSHDGQQLCGIMVFPQMIRIEKNEPLDPVPMRHWLGELEDQWLRTQIEERLKLGTNWDIAVAVGLYARLRQHTGQRAKLIVQSLLSGEIDPIEDRPWQWSRKLSEPQSRQLQRLLTVNLSQLSEQMEYIEQSPAYDDPNWRESCKEILYGRDDIESVRILLCERKENDAIDSGIATFDANGEAFLAGLPHIAEWLDDERFIRVLSVTPTCWWARGATTQFAIAPEVVQSLCDFKQPNAVPSTSWPQKLWDALSKWTSDMQAKVREFLPFPAPECAIASADARTPHRRLTWQNESKTWSAFTDLPERDTERTVNLVMMNLPPHAKYAYFVGITRELPTERDTEGDMVILKYSLSELRTAQQNMIVQLAIMYENGDLEIGSMDDSSS
jgi:hypothetical protein